MKKLLMIIFAICILSPINAGIKISYTDFEIGKADARIRLFSDSLYGARGDGLRMGGTVSTLDFNQSFTSYNPACLAFQKAPVASFSGIPFEFVSTDFVGFIINRDFNADLADMIENSISDMTTPTASVKDASLYIAQANGITGMEGMLPFADNNAAIGVAREEKLGLEMKILGDAIRASMDISDPSNLAFAMSLSATAALAADINLKSMVTSIGIGRKINPQWGIGAVLEYIDTRFSADANAGAQATGDIMGTSFEYNTSPSNSLDQYIKGEMKAAAWALRVGTSFHAPDDVAEVAVDFSIQPRFKFEGTMEGMAHTLPTDSATIENDFLNGTPSTVADPWTSEGLDMYMKLPSFFRLTLSWKPGPAVLTFNYTRFFDNFSLSIEDSEMIGNFYMAMTDIFRIGLNFQYFQLGGGMVLGRQGSVFDLKNDSNAPQISDVSTPFPVASMGFIIPIGSYIKTEWEMVAFPVLVLKSSLTITY